MPKRVVKAYPNEIYHLYNRGAFKSTLFFKDEHYEHFLQLMALYANKYNITIVAYCLMPNHFHIVVRVEPDGDVSEFMRLLCSRYSLRCNRKLTRSGTLYEGRYKMEHVNNESYLRAVCRYLPLNPVKAGLVRDPLMYRYSSYRECVGVVSQQYCDTTIINRLFRGRKNYERFVKAAIHDVRIADLDLAQALAEMKSV